MKIKFFKWLIIIISALAFFGTMAFYFYIYGIPGTRINDPIDFYKQGELASTPESRKNAFNKSLSSYLEMEKKYDPQYGTGKLYYNIGNSYFQLSEYPMALLYYYKSSLLRPADSRVQDGINASLQKLDLPYTREETEYYTFSLPESLQYFSLAFMVFFFVFSAYIWLEKKWLKWLLYLSAAAWICFGAALIYTLFFSPIEGVVMKGTSLYKHPGTQYTKVSDKPIPAGLKVRVIMITPDKEWVKIVSPQNEMGYVKGDSLKVINGIL